MGAGGDRPRGAERGGGAALEAERGRLRHVEALRAAAAGGVGALAGGDEDGGGAALALAAAAQALEARRRGGRGARRAGGRVRALALEAEDLVHDLHRYAEGVEAAPGRLDEVEERLALLDRLKRKHGGTIAAVLEHAAACRAPARRAGRRRGGDRGRRGRARGAAGRARRSAAAALSKARREAAAALAGAVRERLAALAMEGAEFTAALAPRDDGFGPTGADEVEFLIAPNPGVPAGRCARPRPAASSRA